MNASSLVAGKQRPNNFSLPWKQNFLSVKYHFVPSTNLATSVERLPKFARGTLEVFDARQSQLNAISVAYA